MPYVRYITVMHILTLIINASTIQSTNKTAVLIHNNGNQLHLLSMGNLEQFEDSHGP